MNEQAPLFTYAQWAAMTDAEREQWRELRRIAVESAREDHQRLVDSLTLERFSRDHA